MFEPITKSAFTQSRKKLKYEAFQELNNEQLSYFINNAPSKSTWKGKRIIAIDGSQLNLPNSDELKEEFGFVKNQYEEIISAKCSFAYDVCNELVIDGIIAPRKSCEKELAVKHISKLNPQTDILVFDRGYPSQWFIGLLLKKGFKFCFRLSTAWKDGVNLAKSDKNDIDWTITRRSKKDLGKLREYGIPTTIDGLRLSAIILSTGEIEILASNLTDREEYSLNDLKELYHLRWGVEEGYKIFKKVLFVEYFTGKTVHAIKQDFYAKIFTQNMASIIGSQGVYKKKKVNSKPKKHKVQLNKTQLVAKLKDFILDIYYKNNLKGIINQMLNILEKRMDIVRPGRAFPRSCSSARRRVKALNYKGV